ncbi:MAG: nuclear transport factor 2 family protein [Sphingomonadales bacterium]|nr:nuclear transport factor 2 family protein [Sphingomonadales bacterium]MDE2568953.1 nuclear transport factor 2 family protein [Sphingomonadales bacterium]
MTQMPEGVRRAVKDLMADYSHNLDAIQDPERVVAIFTPDAVIDFSPVGFPTMNGEEDIRAFYTGLFPAMQGQFHDMANFRPASWDGEVAVVETYVIGMGQPKEGDLIHVQVKYRWECIETANGWKCRHFSLTPMMPA